MIPTRRLWIGVSGPTLDNATKRLLDDVEPGGVILFRRNIVDLEQVSKLTADLKNHAGTDLVISVDQEGGLVLRFYKELTAFPGNMALGAAAFREPSLGEHLALEQGTHMGRELRALGITVNLAPVVDLAIEGGNPSGGIRSFGAPPELAEKLGAAFVRGLHRGGVHACLKHFPGLGPATVDSHLDLPVIDNVNQEPHLRPFRAGITAGARLVMTSHVIYKAIDSENPATLSPSVVRGVLRDRLGFRGVVATDELEMGAMTRHFGFDAMVHRAVAAGHDVLCICWSPELMIRAAELLREGLGTAAAWMLDSQSVAERLQTLAPLPDAGPPDRAAADALAVAIAGRSIAVVRDPQSLIPLQRGKKILLAMPTLRSETLAENPLRGEEDGSALSEALGASADVHSLPTDPSRLDVDALLLRAADYDVLLVVLTNARFVDAQAELARRSVRGHPRCVLLPIRSPFDLEVVPPGTSHAAVASFGFRPVQFRALVKVLRGDVLAYGQLPITLRSRLG